MRFKVILTEHTLYKKLYQPEQWQARISSLKDIGFQDYNTEDINAFVASPYDVGSIEIMTTDALLKFIKIHGECLVFIDEYDNQPVIEIQ